MNLLLFLLAFASCLCLSLGMKPHGKSLALSAQGKNALFASGWILLALTLVLATHAQGGYFGVLVWLGDIALAAPLQALLLTYVFSGWPRRG